MRPAIVTALCVLAFGAVCFIFPSHGAGMGKRGSEESGRTSSTGIGGTMEKSGGNQGQGTRSTMDTNTNPGGSGTGSSTLDSAHDRSTSGAPGGMSGSGAGQR